MIKTGRVLSSLLSGLVLCACGADPSGSDNRVGPDGAERIHHLRERSREMLRPFIDAPVVPDRPAAGEQSTSQV